MNKYVSQRSYKFWKLDIIKKSMRLTRIYRFGLTNRGQNNTLHTLWSVSGGFRLKLRI